MDQTPEEIVSSAEAALANSQPCPYCGIYDGTHAANCVYLLHKGDVDAKASTGPVVTGSNKTVEVAKPVVKEPEEVKAEEPKTLLEGETELLEKMKPKK